MSLELISEPVITFNDKELSSYIYENHFQIINLEQRELEPIFIKNVLKNETIKELCNCYLTYLEKNEENVFKQLKHENGFDMEEVINSFSAGLKSDFQKIGTVFQVYKYLHKEDYENENPLDNIINSQYIKSFCNGLELSYKERALFILALANEEWGWLFPFDKSDEYKSHLFTQICNTDVNNETNLTRKINNHLMQQGLFSSPWKVNKYVYSFFKGENPSFSLEQIKAKPMQDIYDYQELCNLNHTSFSILTKQITEYQKNKKGCWQIICSNNDFRNKNLLVFHLGKNHKLFSIKQELVAPELKELAFYIYALSLKLADTGNVLFLPENFTRRFISDKEEERNVIRIRQTNETPEVEWAGSILEKIQIPVIISMTEPLLNLENTGNSLEKNGINVLYKANLKLPGANIYEQRAKEYFYNEKIPVNMICSAVDQCKELNLNPEKWDEVTEILKNATSLTTEESLELLKQKYGKTLSKENLRKNSHYCMEALNTTESIEEITQALKNVKESYNQEYNEETGARILLYGISGGGKTAYVEQIAKLLDMPLKIVRASEILGSYVGDTEKNIHQIFEKAAENKSILLIDEADSFLHCRGDNVNHHNDSKVNQFLIEMERYPGILFCNTNLPENLDSATDRRFHFKVGFNALTKNGITLLCHNYFNSFALTEDQISKIYSSGEVTPGDFGALSGRIRFVNKEKVNSEYITEELCKMVASKNRSNSNRKIGFCC